MIDPLTSDGIHAVDYVREGRQPASHFADAVKTMELVERIIRAGDVAGRAGAVRPAGAAGMAS